MVSVDFTMPVSLLPLGFFNTGIEPAQLRRAVLLSKRWWIPCTLRYRRQVWPDGGSHTVVNTKVRQMTRALQIVNCFSASPFLMALRVTRKIVFLRLAAFTQRYALRVC